MLLLELNEVNFDYVEAYINRGEKLPNFKKLISGNKVVTKSEDIYENIEPWIQWVSAHTGLEYAEHNVFHLGDITNHEHPQIFESVELQGFKVGAVSPMNAKNTLKQPTFFIPDPWTDTPTDGSFVSRAISTALKQAVNDNAKGKITLNSIFNLGLGLLLTLGPVKCFSLIPKLKDSLGASWRKAIFLDELLFEVFLSLLRKKKTDFATLFLNSGAHIQHHYLHSSGVLSSANLSNPTWYINQSDDPLIEVLQSYDDMLGRLYALNRPFIVATGMSQENYLNPIYYYRLNDHAKFLTKAGFTFARVNPRMTRDFEVIFDSHEDCEIFLEKVNGITINGLPMFDASVVNETSCFVTLSYPEEIQSETYIKLQNDSWKAIDEVVFVAIKNGHHIDKGWLFTHGFDGSYADDGMHVKNIYHLIDNYFSTA